MDAIGGDTIVEESRGRWQTRRIEFEGKGIFVTTGFRFGSAFGDDGREITIQTRIDGRWDRRNRTAKGRRRRRRRKTRRGMIAVHSRRRRRRRG